MPAPGAFTVTVAGAARSLAASDPVAVSGKTVTLTLASAAAHGEAVTLAYTVPAAQPLRNLAGLGAPGFAGREVANATPDATAPVLLTSSVDGAALVLTYDEALDEASVPAPGAFAVTVAGTARSLAASDPVAVSGKTVTLTLASAAAHGEAVTLAYTVPAAQPLRNLAGLGAPGFAGREVANATPDVTAPVLLTSSVDGAALVLTYDEALDEDLRAGPGRVHGDRGGRGAGSRRERSGSGGRQDRDADARLGGRAWRGGDAWLHRAGGAAVAQPGRARVRPGSPGARSPTRRRT